MWGSRKQKLFVQLLFERVPTQNYRILEKHAQKGLLDLVDCSTRKCPKRNQVKLCQMSAPKIRIFTNTIHQAILDLPHERFDRHVVPFNQSRVGYFGPIEVKFLRYSLMRLCCLFTYLLVRAVNIKVAIWVDTESCPAKVTGFIVRSSYLNIINKDNGTNFVGAACELKSIRGRMDQS